MVGGLVAAAVDHRRQVAAGRPAPRGATSRCGARSSGATSWPTPSSSWSPRRGSPAPRPGTPALNVWLRSLGTTIGRGVWCETYWLPEPDLVELRDGATVNAGCVVQTHLFHDRVMSMDRVVLRAGATLGPNSVILPAATIGRHATVGPVSLVMRGESVPDKTRWIGNPIGPWADDGDLRRHEPCATPTPTPRPRRPRLRRHALRPRPDVRRRDATGSTATARLDVRGPRGDLEESPSTCTRWTSPRSPSTAGRPSTATAGTRCWSGPRTPVPVGDDLHPRSCATRGTRRPVKSRHLGAAGWEELADGVIVAGQPHGAPTWFPCNDRPVEQGVVPHQRSPHPPATASSPTAGWPSSRRRSSAVTWVYEQDEPMATYLATVHIGRYEVRTGGDGAGPDVRRAPADAAARPVRRGVRRPAAR